LSVRGRQDAEQMSLSHSTVHLETMSEAEVARPKMPDDGVQPNRSIDNGLDASHRPELEAELELYRDILQRVIEVASEAAQGNLEARLLHCDDSEKLRQISRSINHLLDMTDAFLREAGAALEHASHGKFFRRVLLRGMRGTFRHKSELINTATEKMARNAASLKEVERLVCESATIAQGGVGEASDALTVVKPWRSVRENRRCREVDFTNRLANQAAGVQRQDRGQPSG
jgi:hypothetical protein